MCIRVVRAASTRGRESVSHFPEALRLVQWLGPGHPSCQRLSRCDRRQSPVGKFVVGWLLEEEEEGKLLLFPSLVPGLCPAGRGKTL